MHKRILLLNSKYRGALQTVVKVIGFTVVCLGGMVVSPAFASDDAGPIGEKCSAEAYRAFDFWLGEWDVYAQGKLAGHNKIVRILQGCALSESWESAGGGKGNSYNAYDARADSWGQYWVDSNGLVLRLVGGPQKGDMVMVGLVTVPDEPNTTVRHEIRWTPQEDGSVRQHWRSARTGSDEWQTVFDGLYVPAGSPPPADSDAGGQ